jgi:alpha-beta hydrolase superfamily lysophospholipase
MDELHLRTTDGVDLFYRRWPAPAATHAVVIAHGLSEHSGRYARVAEALVDRGFTVYAPDHRGHGLTAPSTGPGRAGEQGMAGILDDLDQLVDLARREVGVDKLILLGHSMGALLSQAWAERYGSKLAGLALSGSPGASDEIRALVEGLKAAVDAGMGDEPLDTLAGFNAPFEPARTPFDWLSRDEAEVDAYIADPLCGQSMPMTYAFVADLLALTVEEMEPAEIARIPRDVPVLLLTGSEDAASGGAVGAHELDSRLRTAGLEVESHYYEGARHEVFNETNRDEVVADLLDWVGRLTK